MPESDDSTTRETDEQAGAIPSLSELVELLTEAANDPELRIVALERELREQREELDPQTSVPHIIDRIATLALRAKRLNTDDAFAPGLAVVERVVFELLTTQVGEKVEGQHRAALECLEVSRIGALCVALDEASQLDNPDRNCQLLVPRDLETANEIRRRDGKTPIARAQDIPRKLTDVERDQLAVECVRRHMGPLIPPQIEDATIASAVETFRHHSLDPHSGRPPKGNTATTEKACAEALASIIACDRTLVKKAVKALKRRRSCRS